MLSSIFIKKYCITLQLVFEELNRLKEFKEALKEYTLGTSSAAEGSKKLDDGMSSLQEETDDLVQTYFSMEIENLTQFVERVDNPRIATSIDDVQINKQAGIIAGTIIMILFTYVISVFVIHGIEQESSIIGALYALGITKKQVTKHYLIMPVLITFTAGITGMLLGFSPLGVGLQTQNTVSYFSLPIIKTVYPIYLLLYGIVMPPLIAGLVNYVVISRKLSQPALKLIKNEQKQSKISNINLGGLGFISRFQIRQFLREMRTSITVIAGLFIAMLVLMLGVDCYVICENLSTQNKEDSTYEFMYTYKYPTEHPPTGGEACYVESLKKEIYGYNLDVTILGIDTQNKYFDFQVSKGKNTIAVSQSTAYKYNLSVSDELVLHDDINGQSYAFTVDKIVPYSIGLYVFMDIESMRELFGQKEDYYNMVLSDTALPIEQGRLYATTTRQDISKNADVFVNNMWSLIISMIIASIFIFIMVMYLMIKVMIDRAALHISLFKIFGYKEKEVRKLYLDGNFIMIVVGAALMIPLSKRIMDSFYPYLISNIASGVDLTFSWKLYGIIYIGVILCYYLIHKILLLRLKKVLPTEVLKNRE